MSFKSVFSSVLWGTCLAAACLSPAFCQEGPAPSPLTYGGAVSPVEALQSLQLPAVDRQARLDEDAQAAMQGPGPLRYAVPEDLLVAPETGGTWEVVPGGDLWRLRIYSPGATDLSLGFTRFNLPEGARLYVLSEDEKYFRGPYTSADNTPHGEFWVPVIPGSRGVVELFVPSSSNAKPVLDLTRVGCGYRDLFKRGAQPKAGTCNIDVICSPEGDAWRDQIQSVAVYGTGGSAFCTGALINNTANDLKMYFLTANHCGLNSGNAPSVVAYWNFFSPTCGQHGGGSLSQATTGGATFRASNATSDFCLIEFVNPPPPAWNVYWSGWDRTTGDVASAVVIHHPNTDEKSISFEDHATATSTYLATSSPGDGTHVWVKDYDVRPNGEGTTEPGSSGSPLYSPEHRIIGQLHGGDAACGNNLADWYGRFDRSWTGGGTNSTRLSNWLDPGSTGVTTLDGTWSCTTPGVPSGLTSTTPINNRIHLSWSAGSPAGAKYRVYRAANKNCGTAGAFDLLASNVIGTTYDDDTVSGSISYAYKVAAVDATGGCMSGQSSCANATPTGPCNAGPEFAGLGSVTNPAQANCRLDLSWSGATTLCGGGITYNVYRSITSPVNPILANRIVTGVAATSYQDSNALVSGTTYFYLVRSVDGSNGAEDTNIVEKSGAPSGTGSGTNTYTSTDVPKTIPDNDPAGVTSNLVVSGNPNSVSDVNVTVNITHTYDSDLSLSLIAPGGVIVPLSTSRGGSGDNFTNTIFDDSAVTAISAGSAPFTGSFGPESPLSTVNGIAANGTWQLKVVDSANIDTGSITGWSLAITTLSSCSTVSSANPKEASPSGNMTCGKGSGTSVNITFTPGCGTTDHVAYYTKVTTGTMPSLTWNNAACGLGVSSPVAFDPGALNPGEWVYFVIVGQNSTKEGSYGRRFDGSGYTERSEAANAAWSCNKVQDLTGACP